LTTEESEQQNLEFIGCDNIECKGRLWYHKECILNMQNQGCHVDLIDDPSPSDPEDIESEHGDTEDYEDEAGDSDEYEDIDEENEEGNFQWREQEDTEEEIPEELVYEPRQVNKLSKSVLSKLINCYITCISLIRRKKSAWFCSLQWEE